SIAAAIAIIDFLLGTLATLGAAPIRYFISVAYEFLYNSFQQFHQGVVLNGLAFPFNKQMDHFAVKHTVHSSLADVTGLRAFDLRDVFPLKKFKVPTAGLESHLVYPRTTTGSAEDINVEQSRTNAAPEPYYNNDPFLYINGPLHLDTQLYQYIKSFTESTGSSGQPSEDMNSNFLVLNRRTLSNGLGNAVDFGKFLFTEVRSGNTIPDFNLDGDRGYAFPCWRRVLEKANFNNKNVLHVAVEEAPPFAKHNVLHTETDIIHPNKDIL
ncbi:MAG: hypothetical protein WKF70_14565, partial [Chitinophagaceae bacterium]